MKKLLCMLLAVMMIAACSFTLMSCGEDTAGGQTEKQTEKETEKETEEEKKQVIPDGYKEYNNDSISFAYPGKWTKSESSVVMLMNETGVGNNITVVYEPKTDEYSKMTVQTFKTQLQPVLEAQGMAISGVSVTQTANDLGTAITKINYKATVQSVTLEQTIYILNADNKTWSVSVTETTSDDALVKNVFDTLVALK